MVKLRAIVYSAFFVLSSILIQAKINYIEDSNNHGLCKGAKNFISSYFTKSEYVSLTINMAMTNSSKLEVNDVGNEILKDIGLRFRKVVRGHQREFRDFDKRRSPVVLVMDTIGAFNAIKLKMKRIYPKYLLVLLVDGIFKEIDEIIKELLAKSMMDVSFLAANDTHVSIYTYFPFKHNQCGTDLSLEIINSLDLATQEWTNSEFYPEKVADLNNCTLKIGVTENIPMVIVNNGTDAQNYFEGVEVFLIRDLSKILNFYADFVTYKEIGAVTRNRSSGVLGATHERKIDVAIGTLSLQIERTNFLSATSLFDSIPIIGVIPPPSHISPFQKLYLPFDITIWGLLLSVFLVGYIVIIASKLISIKIYRFIVGQKVNFPFTNMLIAFFGGSQKNLPKSTFSRSLLGKFLIFCIVIRGLYQGKLFDIMKKDIFEKVPATFDDLVARNYVFYTYESLSRRVQGFKFANNVKVIKNTEIEYYRQKTLDSNFKGVVFSYEPQVIYLNFLNKKSHTYLILKERFVTNQMVFYLQENHFLAEKFYEKINWFRDFGITNYILSIFIDPLYYHRIQSISSSKPLSLHELSAVFCVWMSGLGLGLVVLIFEMGIGYKRSIVKRKLRRHKIESDNHEEHQIYID